MLEAETIMQDVVQRRRRVFGPAHPETRISEAHLLEMRTRLEQWADDDDEPLGSDPSEYYASGDEIEATESGDEADESSS